MVWLTHCVEMPSRTRGRRISSFIARLKVFGISTGPTVPWLANILRIPSMGRRCNKRWKSVGYRRQKPQNLQPKLPISGLVMAYLTMLLCHESQTTSPT